jgi:hypothetical protein
MSANKGAQLGAWTPDNTQLCGTADFILPGPIQVTYTAGDTVELGISISTNHDGYYEFRLCVPKKVTDGAPTTNQQMYDCLTSNQAVLLEREKAINLATDGQTMYKISGGNPTWSAVQLKTRWRQNPEDGTVRGQFRDGKPAYYLNYKIPSNVQCNNCVLHWYWQSLNSYQTGASNTIATANGERFWNCADIAITNPTLKAQGITDGISGSGHISGKVPVGDGGDTPSTPTPPTPSTPTPSKAPTPTPSKAPTPTPSKAPTPTPSKVPTSGGKGCQSLKYNQGSSPSVWYIGVAAIADSVEIKCSDGSTQGCTSQGNWGGSNHFGCAFQNGGCSIPHKAIVDGTECPSIAAAATETDSVVEGDSSESTQSTSSSDSSVPGWGIALIVLAVLIVIVLVVIAALMFSSSKQAERF